jgi:hypothetical protein
MFTLSAASQPPHIAARIVHDLRSCPCHPPSLCVKYKTPGAHYSHLTRHLRKSRPQNQNSLFYSQTPFSFQGNLSEYRLLLCWIATTTQLQLKQLLTIQSLLFDEMDRIPGRPTSFIRGGVRNSNTTRKAPVQCEQMPVPWVVCFPICFVQRSLMSCRITLEVWGDILAFASILHIIY